MAQLDNVRLQSMFVDMARQAFALKDKLDLLQGVSSEKALRALSTVREELSESEPGEPRDWVRSEAEAALFWRTGLPTLPTAGTLVLTSELARQAHPGSTLIRCGWGTC